MLIERILADLDLPTPADHGGNPLRGSRLGRCGRQSAYMQWPHLFPPEPLSARAKLVFRFGDMIHEMIRREFRRVLPGEWGMEEERFWFSVPLSTKEADLAQKKIDQKVLKGPRLDPAGPTLLVPVAVDGIADLSAFNPHYGLASVEIKSMTTAGFRRALQGQVEYSYRTQMAVEAEAAGVDTHVYVAIRKDTCHVLEVIYSKRATSVEVRFTKSSKLVEILHLAGVADESDLWEAAEVQHPFEPELLDEARQRVRRVLVSLPDAPRHPLPPREYGPDFTCSTCQGTGTQTLAKTTKEPLKRGPKPCKDCVGGQLTEALLTFNCSYCPFTEPCWSSKNKEGGSFRLYTLEVSDRPRYIVQRDIYEAAGITILKPGEQDFEIPVGEVPQWVQDETCI